MQEKANNANAMRRTPSQSSHSSVFHFSLKVKGLCQSHDPLASYLTISVIRVHTAGGFSLAQFQGPGMATKRRTDSMDYAVRRSH